VRLQPIGASQQLRAATLWFYKLREFRRGIDSGELTDDIFVTCFHFLAALANGTDGRRE